MSEKLQFDLVTGRNNLKDNIVSTQKEASRLENILQTAAGVFAGQIAVKGFEVLAGAASRVRDTLFEAIDASAIQEKAINDLNSSLAQAGNLIGNTSQELQEFASSLQQASTFGDEAILSNIALLQSLTNLDKDGLKAATSSAADLAARLGTDLESATRLVARAANGQTEALRRLGIEVQKGANDTETFNNALTALNAQFGGAAASQLNTFAGASQALGNAYGDLLEPVGDIITQNPLIIAGFQTLKEIIEELTGEVNSNKGSLSDLVQEGLINLADGARIAAESTEVLVKSIELVGRSVLVPIQGLQALGAIVTDVFGLTEDAVSETSKSIIDNFNGIAGTITESGTFGKLADQILDFKTRSLIALSEVEKKQAEGIKNGQERVTAEGEITQQILDSRRKLQQELEVLQAEAKIKEQEAFLQTIELGDTRRQAELERLVAFEKQKTEILVQQAAERAAKIQDAELQGLQSAVDAEKQKVASVQETTKQAKRANDEKLAAERIYSSQLQGLIGATANTLAVIAKDGSKEQFIIRQASALASAIIAKNLAVANANTIPEPTARASAIAAARAQGLISIAGIGAATIKGFQDGGVIGGIRGSSIGGDNTTVNAREGEMILNADQQKRLLALANGESSNREIIIQIDGREIARAVRDQRQAGFEV